MCSGMKQVFFYIWERALKSFAFERASDSHCISVFVFAKLLSKCVHVIFPCPVKLLFRNKSDALCQRNKVAPIQKHTYLLYFTAQLI